MLSAAQTRQSINSYGKQDKRTDDAQHKRIWLKRDGKRFAKEGRQCDVDQVGAGGTATGHKGQCKAVAQSYVNDQNSDRAYRDGDAISREYAFEKCVQRFYFQ